MKKTAAQILCVAALVFHTERAWSVEFEKLGSAVAKALGTKKAFKTTVNVGGKPTTVFYSKASDGKANHFAVIQSRIYEPACTHTWVVGINAATDAVSEVRTVEMSCPHAFPCQKAGFLDQYRGKGPADTQTLKNEVHTIAKATGTSNLTTDAVVTAITAAGSLKGKL